MPQTAYTRLLKKRKRITHAFQEIYENCDFSAFFGPNKRTTSDIIGTCSVKSTYFNLYFK